MPRRPTCASRDRVAEQAKYFHVTIQEALQIGLEAERFTRKKLSRPFTIRTRKQDARGRSRRPRYFAFVQTDTGDLGEQLIANGLARVYGAASGPPGMRTPEGEWRKLKQLERKAKKQKIGGWGIGATKQYRQQSHGRYFESASRELIRMEAKNQPSEAEFTLLYPMFANRRDPVLTG